MEITHRGSSLKTCPCDRGIRGKPVSGVNTWAAKRFNGDYEAYYYVVEWHTAKAELGRAQSGCTQVLR